MWSLTEIASSTLTFLEPEAPVEFLPGPMNPNVKWLGFGEASFSPRALGAGEAATFLCASGDGDREGKTLFEPATNLAGGG